MAPRAATLHDTHASTLARHTLMNIERRNMRGRRLRQLIRYIYAERRGVIDDGCLLFRGRHCADGRR